MGLSNKALKHFKEADKYYSQCLKLFIELKHIAGQAVVYNNLGIVNKESGNKEVSLNYFTKSLEIREQMGSKQGIAVVYNNIGELYTQYNEYEKAIDYLKKSLVITSELGFKDLLFHNYGLLNKAYFNDQKLDSAYHYLSLLSILKDTLNNQQRTNQLSELEVRFETENKEREIEVLEKEKIIQNEQVERQKWQIVAVVSGLVLSLVVVLMVYINLRSKSKAKEEIEKQKQLVDETNEELNQSNEELLAQRDEIESQKIEVETQKSLVDIKNKEITDSITYAKRKQKAILPSEKLINEQLKQSFVLYKPKDIIAGDFYWLETIENRTYFAVADCTGHGVPGAMVSVVCNNALNRVLREFKFTKPSKILDKVREIVLSEFSEEEGGIRDGMDIALCMIEGDKLEYSGANSPLWIVRGDEVLVTKANRQPIGRYENKKPFVNHEIYLLKGDLVMIFTDGYADQFGGEKGKKMGYKIFRDRLLELKPKSLKEKKLLLNEFFESWKREEEQVDDVCVMGVSI